MRCFSAVSFVLIALAFAAGLQAHRVPEALTSIEYNLNTGSTEIVHRLHVHDIEPNIDRILTEGGQSLETLEGRARVSLYVQERFEIILDGELKSAVLSLLGAEIEGQYLYVYQEYKGELSDSLKIRNDILRDVFSAQVNTVNLKIGSDIRSFVFAKKDRWKTLILSSEPNINFIP